ncbi:hypothetical protein HMPREF0183_2039 [Brevibacterium mcbrellneri ATCC 49030]|uniref:LPXTG-motif cell wall anchor domain protein n=2 Tax=Brevibacterium TaxID=1696 RepID=D4YQ29_9MICO|nr:hypothetical protein HMPREF0183_2039 [Brevibacterium mcbrellneri ATCC 49030]
MFDMRITALSATALAVAALGGAPALAAIPQAPASITGTASASDPTDEPSPAPTDGPTAEPSPAPSPEPTTEPTPKSTKDPGQSVTPSTVINRGEWYQVMVDDKPAPEGSTFSAVERKQDGKEKIHDFIVGEGGRAFHLDTSKPHDQGEAVDPREVTLKIENGSVEFINKPTPTPPPNDGKTPPEDDNGSQKPPRPKPPLTKPPAPNPPDEDGRQPGKRPGNHGDGNSGDESDNQENPDGKDGNTKADDKDRTQDPDTGNGTVPGQAGTDWTPGDSGDEQTHAPDYSDPVPQNPDEAGEVSEDIIAGPEPSQENHTGAPTAPSNESEDKAVDAAEPSGSFPWSLAVLLGAGAVGLFLAVFLFARRKSED